ncbi:adenylyltransferase/cytidyltransferase family protein [Helicobacter kayseriensis]|uniref:adenylyltransferase/cytidyltransferase family protein n=1 Tax=Helicobacter kayseriensis TaxID=2905877 RepID=UPI001E601F5E|nr:adenylyltransferase/cytidyltransferase family protein [Helicobacter kayseriensis]MCE3047263.1 adenylyltransferase/cytidyltransferase family protein [Helicobacter kayseriensis]MCE3048634.1 adenylyltransferase/cytidyltransferase family protein [Helicobacter kayseriensis]
MKYLPRADKKHRTKIPSIVVYGGSFDPIHLGHIGAIQTALKILNPSLFLVVPAFRNPFKSCIKYSTHQRTKWLKRAIKQINDKRVQLCLFEIKRNAPTPTILTIQYLKKTFNTSKIYFLLGEDNLEHLHTWDAFPLLAHLVEFILLKRQGYSPIPHSYKMLPLDIPASSTQIRNGKQREFLPPFLKGLR